VASLVLAIAPTVAFVVLALLRFAPGRTGEIVFFVALAVVQGLSIVLAIVGLVLASRRADGLALAVAGLIVGVLGGLFMFLVVGLALGTLLGTSS
jgi:uncharacterized protein YqgC (DUF456 family)